MKNSKEYAQVTAQIKQRLKSSTRSMNAGIALTLVIEEASEIIADLEIRLRALEATGMEAMIKHNPQLAGTT